MDVEKLERLVHGTYFTAFNQLHGVRLQVADEGLDTSLKKQSDCASDAQDNGRSARVFSAGLYLTNHTLCLALQSYLIADALHQLASERQFLIVFVFFRRIQHIKDRETQQIRLRARSLGQLHGVHQLSNRLQLLCVELALLLRAFNLPPTSS